MKNQLYYDDLYVLQTFPDEYVDLIYLYQPFNLMRDYNIIFLPDTTSSKS